MHSMCFSRRAFGLLRGAAAAAWLAVALAASPPHANAQPTPVFGPEDFVRQRGAPAVVTRSFAVDAPAGLYRLRIDNGGATSQLDRVSSAIVTLNGAVVVAPDAFNQTVQVVEREIALAPQNELRVELRSAPGSGFTLAILQVPLAVRITAPEAGLVTPDDAVDVGGTLQGNALSIAVNGVPAQVDGETFAARVPLAEGTNRIVAIATGAAGEAAVDSVLVRRDTDPPLVVIETPRDGERLITESVTIAGTVNDIIPGATVNSDDVTVTVNGQPAAVNNRTFTFPDLPLALGENRVTAVAVDRAGNTRSTEIAVTREPDLAGIRIAVAGGNNQRGPVGSSLPLPLAVAVRTEGGEPLAGRPVVFEVSKGDGLLGDPDANLRRVMLLTDAAGMAAVPFTLGSRTGEGFHRVFVTTPGSLTFAELCATALPTAPVTMSVTLRPPVRSAAGERMGDPLAVIVTDAGGNPVPGVPVTFRVELGGGSFDGAASVVATTNPDGIAQAVWTLGPDPGMENNRASADFEGNPGFPAEFVVSGLQADPSGETRVSGIVQDSTGGPIVGARIEIRGTGLEAFTGPDGRFTISGVPPGEQRVAILGSTANDPGRGIFFPHIDFALQVVQGAANALDQIVVLPFLDMAGSKVVGGDEDVILGMEGVPGFGIKVFAHSAILPDGSRGTVRMSSSQVKFDKVPMPPPRGSTAFIVGTLQPGGIRFDPPAQVIYPNVEGLAPGDVADVYAFHHDIGQFVNVGPGTVSEDGSVIASDPGFGLVESGWHCLIRLPGPTASCANGCSASLEWQLVKADGTLGPVKSGGPVNLCSADNDAKKAKVQVTFTPGGGSFDSASWSGGPPVVTRSEESTAGTAARVTLTAAGNGSSMVTSPTYRIPQSGGQADKTCQAEVGVKSTLIMQTGSPTNDLWWFDGANAANYSERVTLTATGVTTGTFRWNVTAGASKINFENGMDVFTATNDNTVDILSTDASAAAVMPTNDITITLQIDGKPACSFQTVVLAPNRLVHLGNTDNASGTGYQSLVNYRIEDQFNRVLPHNVEINEDWGAAVSDFAGENWVAWNTGCAGDATGQNCEGSATVGPAGWADNITRPGGNVCGAASNQACNPPRMNPQTPLGNVMVDHRPGTWRCGSLTVNVGPANNPGRIVRTLTWQLFQDHGRN